MLLWSKLAAVAALQIPFVLQCLPPNTLSAKAGDKHKDKYFAGGTITAANVISFALVLTGCILFFDDTMGRRSLRQPWSTADAVYVTAAVLGAVLRVWAMRVLARHFTFEVGIVKDHKLIQSGPYRIIRHPGYTGAILSFFGLFGFMGLRPPGLLWFLVYALPMTLLMVARIPNEEQTLHQHFGRQWEQHCKQTWRLLPPLY